MTDKAIVVGTDGTEAGAKAVNWAAREAQRRAVPLRIVHRIRKELAGLPPDWSAAAGYRQGIYTTEWTDRTYRELLRSCRTAGGAG